MTCLDAIIEISFFPIKGLAIDFNRTYLTMFNACSTLLGKSSGYSSSFARSMAVSKSPVPVKTCPGVPIRGISIFTRVGSSLSFYFYDPNRKIVDFSCSKIHEDIITTLGPNS